MSLSTEQLALLNNLTYLNNSSGLQVREMSDFEGKTIGDWLNNANIRVTDKNAFTTQKEWDQVVNAIKHDPTLMNMKIADTHVDNGPDAGGGRSVVFISEEQNEAVVAFMGTAGGEWHDDCKGAAMTDTPQQQNALDWYRETYAENNLDQYEVTLTGHSKGGNKAKYITILDDTPDRCVSFDGQGFSDEFYDKYSDQIAAHQGKITNNNAEYDYVNILLNDVGETTYYEGHNIGKGGFAENHCANTILDIDENGNVTMTPTEQGHEMKAVDEFLNSYIRSIPVEERGDMIDLAGKILTEMNSFGDMSQAELVNYFLDLATNPKYADDLAYLAAYAIRYAQEHPEAMDDIRGIMEQMGLGGFVQYVDVVEQVLNIEIDAGILGTYHFDDILRLIGELGGKIPDWLMKLILDEINKKTGLSLTPAQIRGLFNILAMTAAYMGTVDVSKNGADLELLSPSSGGGSTDVKVFLKAFLAFIDSLFDQVKSVSRVGDDLDALSAEEFNDALGDVKGVIRKELEKIRDAEDMMKQMHKALSEARNLYEKTEKEIATFR